MDKWQLFAVQASLLGDSGGGTQEERLTAKDVESGKLRARQGVCSRWEGGVAGMQERQVSKLAQKKLISLFSGLIRPGGAPRDTWLEKNSSSSLRALIISSESLSSAPRASETNPCVPWETKRLWAKPKSD